MKAELVPANGDSPIPISRDVTVVGRRAGCDVVINHAPLSKRHCVLVRTDGLLIVRDLATTNGTKVNGQRVRWAALLPRDKLSLAGYKMSVYLGPDDAPSPSERFALDRLRESGDAADLFPSPTPELSPPIQDSDEEGPAAADFFDDSSAEIEARTPAPKEVKRRPASVPKPSESVPRPSSNPSPSERDDEVPFFIRLDEP